MENPLIDLQEQGDKQLLDGCWRGEDDTQLNRGAGSDFVVGHNYWSGSLLSMWRFDVRKVNGTIRKDTHLSTSFEQSLSILKAVTALAAAS
jgi:hypothetical protein